jgi:hypothetical protein
LVGRHLLLAIVGLVAACNVQAFACVGDGDCMLGGEPGVCVEGNCAYPDATCPSGLRYPAGLGNGLAGACVPPDEVTSAGTEAVTSEGPSSTGSSGPPATTAPPATDDTSSSTTQSLDATRGGDGSTSSSTGKDDDTTGNASSAITGGSTFAPPASVCLELMDCADCMRCVDGDGEPCSDQAAACSVLPGCPEAAGCMEFCVAFDDCATDCCAGVAMDAVSAAIDLHDCRVEVCQEQGCFDVDPLCM